MYENACPTSIRVSEQMTKIRGSTDACSLFHFLLLSMPQFIIKMEDDQKNLKLYRRNTTKNEKNRMK